MDWRIAEAVPGDAPRVAGMVEELLAEIMTATDQSHFHFDEEETRARAEDFLGRGVYRVLLARGSEGDAPVGMLSMTEVHALYSGGAFGLITEFFVRPDCRSRGAGRSLLEKARRKGRETGWGRLEVTTPPLPAFERSFSFYKQLGFAVSGGRKMKLEL